MFPALALAGPCAGRGREVALVTDGRGARYVGGELPYTSWSPRAARRAGSASGCAASSQLARGAGPEPARLSAASSPAAAVVRRLCLGAGGGRGAASAGVPLLVHEQNAVSAAPTG